jgi:5-(carboxyamino)imidazole ribonucleotide synthase
MTALAPGSAIGIVGGGQLGRMTAMAAARLGLRVVVLTPERDAPASHVAARTIVAAYDDQAALADFAAAVAVVTYEFENVPHAPLAALAARVPVRPSPRILAICQDRGREKHFLAAIGIATAPYRDIEDEEAFANALAEIGRPAVLKTATLGYDGKGQVLIDASLRAEQAWRALGGRRAILEGFVEFEREISIVLARGLDGAIAAYVPVENEHRHHILDRTLAPARLRAPIAEAADAIARRIAERLDLVGVLAVEMFVTQDGRVLVNELAPRPHNSGHWTIDACATSQFEQVVRAICGWPLGSPERHHDAEMVNLIGEDSARWARFVAEPGTRVHLYGKAETRPGRKMGHLTRLYPRSGAA